LSAWKLKIVAFAGVLGAPGLFLISFLDSSILTFPVINDLLLVELAIQHPLRMPLYAAMAMIGSVLGCVLLYYIARKGGEAFYQKRAGERGKVIRHWVERNGFGGMLLAALLPPPTPFKIPAGIKLIRVDAKSGMRVGPGEGGRGVILEAFKPGTAPPDNYSVIGVADADRVIMPQGTSPDAGNIMRPGTGGLY